MKTYLITALAASAAALTACAGTGDGMAIGKSMAMVKPMAMYSQNTLPDTMKVPAGHKVALETVGVGEITYECRVKKDMADAFEWVFVGPKAALNDRSGKQVGSYYGPPATWAAMDGSKITGTQLAVSPGMKGSIPMQLVKANPAMGQGAMMGVTYIQRVATKGGVAPAMACSAGTAGKQEIVKYQADYIFWKAA